METLSAVEAFVRSAEAGSFSAAARKLSLTPAAVSKSVAKLEDSLGARLFQRTTRRLSLTEAGEHLYGDASRGLTTLQDALARVSGERLEPTGTLKVSLAPSFGRVYVQPVLPAYLRACPKVTVDWHFENRQVDLVGENFDVGIGAGVELGAGIVAKELARVHIVAVASKAYLKANGAPKTPSELKDHQGVCFRSARTGKLRLWPLRNAAGKEHVDDLQQRVVFNEIEAMSARVARPVRLARCAPAATSAASACARRPRRAAAVAVAQRRVGGLQPEAEAQAAVARRQAVAPLIARCPRRWTSASWASALRRPSASRCPTRPPPRRLRRSTSAALPGSSASRPRASRSSRQVAR